jgi:hypothetical protein
MYYDSRRVAGAEYELRDNQLKNQAAHFRIAIGIGYYRAYLVLLFAHWYYGQEEKSW